MRMRISKFEARQTMYFEKEMHYRFRFSNTDEKLITTRHRIPVNAPCHPPPRVFFLFHPPSLPRPIPFSYIFDALCLDAARYKSHYLRIVGSGTRLRGQRDTVDFPLSHPHRFTNPTRHILIDEFARPCSRSPITIIS